jgi:SAM-dependent methyltransferase
LDIGTGTGALALNYYKFIRPYDKVYCLDVSELMINNLKQKLSIEQISQSRFIVDDALNFLINTDLTFDVIGFASSLHHMFDYEYVIEKACIKIKKDGYLYIALEPKSQGSILETTYRKYENIIKRYKMNEFSFLRLVIKALYIPFHFLNKFSIPTNIAIENEANIKSEVVISGLNLNRILEILHSNNMEICKLNNGASYIYKLSFKLMNLLGLNTHFELIAKKRK